MTREAIGDADVSAQAADQAAADAQAEGHEQDQGAAPVSARDAAFAELRAGRAAELEREHEEAVELGMATPKGGEKAEEKPADALDPDAPVFKQDGKWMTKIKVNGEEKVVPYDHVVRTVQKHEAADVRLHQASETLRQAQTKAQQIVEQAVLDAKKRGGERQPSSEGDAADVDVQAEAERIVNELVEGNPKEGAKLLAQTLGRLKATPQGDAPQVVNLEEQVVATVTRLDDHKALVAAVGNFRKKHADLAGDEVLSSMVDAESARVKADPDFQGASYDDILEESAQRVKKRVAESVAKTQPTAVADRQQRKVAAAAPGPGVAARRQAPQQPQPPSALDKLAQMRAARGQG